MLDSKQVPSIIPSSALELLMRFQRLATGHIMLQFLGGYPCKKHAFWKGKMWKNHVATKFGKFP